MSNAVRKAALAPARETDAQTAQSALAAAADLARRLADTANARDQAGGHAAREREWIRESGLLTLSIPTAYGGQGADWPTVLQVVRILARADSALAHIVGFHHLQLAGIQLYGTVQQQRRFLTLTAEQQLFWGNALNPLDRRTTAIEADYGFVLDGVMSFSSGSVGADWLTVSAWHADTETALIGVLPTRQPGVDVQADWDAFGQKQTDSGTVRFEQVALPATQVLQAPGAAATPQSTLRSQVAQLMTRWCSTAARYGFDRYWRNVRVHTLHDPVDYKIRDLGRHALDGTLPAPTAYS